MNYMIDEVNDGRTIFYDFYTNEQKQQDPGKENTGLFFFRGNPHAPFAIICPGGAFSYMERRVENLRSAGVEVAYHRYERAGHGFGLGTGTDAEGWLDLAVQFWQKHISEQILRQGES